MYNTIVGNTPFVKTFLAVEESFEKTVKEYIAFYKKVFSELQKMGITVSNEPNSEFVWINGYGTVLLEKNKEYKKLIEELNKPEYKKMLYQLISKAK